MDGQSECGTEEGTDGRVAGLSHLPIVFQFKTWNTKLNSYHLKTIRNRLSVTRNQFKTINSINNVIYLCKMDMGSLRRRRGQGACDVTRTVI